MFSVLYRVTSRERKKGKRMVCDCQFDPGTYTHICTALISVCVGGVGGVGDGTVMYSQILLCSAHAHSIILYVIPRYSRGPSYTVYPTSIYVSCIFTVSQL